MIKRSFLIFLFALLLSTIAASAWLWAAFSASPVHLTKSPLTFIVPKGAAMTDVAEILRTQGIDHRTYYLLLLTKYLGQRNPIKAGEYQIFSGTTPKQLVAKLAKGQQVLHKITFPEGITFRQMQALLAAEPHLAHANGADVMTTIGHPSEHPEGAFYPDTYLFTLNTPESQICRLAYHTMQKKLTQAWNARAANLPYQTPYEALIVASLIEREVVLPRERPLVAGVILRRLKIGMRLQIDAAVLYGASEKNLTQGIFASDTPYNTYLHPGLPPTPIAMPGIASIEAALHPSAGTALYYVAKGDGSHIFSDTLAAHQIAVQAYRHRHTTTPLFYDAGPMCFSGALLLHSWLANASAIK